MIGIRNKTESAFDGILTLSSSMFNNKMDPEFIELRVKGDKNRKNVYKSGKEKFRKRNPTF